MGRLAQNWYDMRAEEKKPLSVLSNPNTKRHIWADKGSKNECSRHCILVRRSIVCLWYVGDQILFTFCVPKRRQRIEEKLELL